ncbi:MAG: DUF4355 domain-containing protein [Olegusella sp.]|nr:DUF4355 domain-containing protein [Olegusella sp.]
MAELDTTQATEGTGQNPSIEGSGGGKTFTQQQVNDIVAERLKRAKETVPADYEELKAKAAKWDEKAEQEKSDLDKLTEKVNQYEKDNEQLTKQLNRIKWVNEVSKSTGLSSDAVSLLRGETAEELQASAQALINSGVSAYGKVPDGGEHNPAPVTKESILQIKDKRERERAIAQHIDLF